MTTARDWAKPKPLRQRQEMEFGWWCFFALVGFLGTLDAILLGYRYL